MTPRLTTAGPAPAGPPATLNLGFLSVLHEPTGYLGGLLVTNVWGRPLEFRLTSAVQPNRVQQILYAGTLEAYLCADLIGRTLVEKSTTPVQMVLTDREAVLDLRWRLGVPVAWLPPAEPAPGSRPAAEVVRLKQGDDRSPVLVCHARFPDDPAAVRGLMERLDPSFDLAEPFVRVREAVAEARKMGAAGR